MKVNGLPPKRFLLFMIVFSGLLLYVMLVVIYPNLIPPDYQRASEVMVPTESDWVDLGRIITTGAVDEWDHQFHGHSTLAGNGAGPCLAS